VGIFLFLTANEIISSRDASRESKSRGIFHREANESLLIAGAEVSFQPAVVLRPNMLTVLSEV
jgi:hypothetical protein